MLDKLFKVLREIHSEPGPTGTLSWSRVGASICLIAVIAWVTYELHFSPTHGLPSLEGPISFFLAPYTIGKVITAAQSFGPNAITNNK